MRRIERAAYSGVGKDIPGPNNYEPKYTLTKKKLKGGDLSVSKAKRANPFEPTKFR